MNGDPTTNIKATRDIVAVWKQSDLDRAEEMHRRALSILQDLGRYDSIAAQYDRLGVVYRLRGDLTRAEEMHRKAIEIDERFGFLEGLANEYGNLGIVHELRGDIVTAKSLWTKARDLFALIGMPHTVRELQAWIDTASAAPKAH